MPHARLDTHVPCPRSQAGCTLWWQPSAEALLLREDANSFLCLPPMRLGGWLLGTPLGRGFSTRPVFTGGGMRSRGSLQTNMGRGAQGQLCQLTTPQCAQRLYLSTRPAAIFIWNATGVKSLWGDFRAAEGHDLDGPFTAHLLLCSLFCFSRGLCCLLRLSLLLLTSCYLHHGDAGLIFPPSLSHGPLRASLPTATQSRYVFISLSKGAVSSGAWSGPSSACIICPARSLGRFVGFPASPSKPQPPRAAKRELPQQGQEHGTPLPPAQKGGIQPTHV